MLIFTIRKKKSKKVKAGEVSVESAKPQGPLSVEWIWNLSLISMHQKWNLLCLWYSSDMELHMSRIRAVKIVNCTSQNTPFLFSYYLLLLFYNLDNLI